MRHFLKRMAYWEIWRSKRLIILFWTAVTICLIWRKAGKPLETKLIKEENSAIKRLDQKEMKNPKTIILIVANQRSGSTFLGEIFNQNPAVFYLFEPLLPFGKHCVQLKNERVKLLQELVQCDFSNMKEAYEKAFDVTKFSDRDAECMKNNLCFETSHKPLLQSYAKVCEDNLRNTTQEKETRKKTQFEPQSTECGFPLKDRLLSQLCKESDIIAYKVLRLCSLSDIEPLYNELRNKGFQIFVLHLVRDPRAVVASRISLRVDGVRLHNAPGEAELLCERYQRNMKYVDELEKDKGSNMISNSHYMRIRHEDFTLSPFEIANKIYKFIEIKMPTDVEAFLSKSHQNAERIMDRIHKEDERAIKEKKEVKKYTRSKDILWHMNNPFGTIRDPKEVLTKWRTQLPYSVVELVQKNCADVFQKLGYKLFESKVDLVNLTRTYY